MTIKQAINILSSDTSFEAVKELQYYSGFEKDKVVEQIQEAMNMGAEALKKQENTKLLKEALIEELNCNCYWTQATFDEDGFCNDDSEQVIDIDRAIEIVKEVMKV